MRKICLLLLAVSCFLVACGKDENKIELFEGYYYGMSYNDVEKRAESSPCPDDNSMLCRRNPVVFFKELWEQRFIFRNNTLIAVEMLHKDPKKVSKIIDTWLDSGYRYMPVSTTSSGKVFDVLYSLRTAGREATREALKNFGKETAEDIATVYLYIDFNKRENLLKNVTSYPDLLRIAPKDLIGIEEIVADKFISVKFLAPIAESYTYK